MGIEYTARVGYGIAKSFQDDLELPLGFKDMEDWYDGVVDEWMQANLYGSLAAEIGGCMMTGEHNWRIVARGTETSVSKYSSPQKYFTELGEVDRGAQLELESLVRFMGLEGDVKIGWKLFWDVT